MKLISLNFLNFQVTPLQWGRCVSSDYGIRGMGVRADPGSFRWCQALSRSRSFATTIGRSRSKSTIIGNSEQSSGEGRRPISCRSRRLAPATNSLPFPITTIFLTILLFLIVYTEADTSIGKLDFLIGFSNFDPTLPISCYWLPCVDWQVRQAGRQASERMVSQK